MKVKCIEIVNPHTGKPMLSSSWLTIGKIYSVLEISASDQGAVKFRILADNKTVPALFDAKQFELVSKAIPRDWCVNFIPGSFLELTPQAWAHDGFWEAYFNCDPDAERIFNDVSRRIIAEES